MRAVKYYTVHATELDYQKEASLGDFHFLFPRILLSSSLLNVYFNDRLTRVFVVAVGGIF